VEGLLRVEKVWEKVVMAVLSKCVCILVSGLQKQYKPISALLHIHH
jgi:hypothetical protein